MKNRDAPTAWHDVLLTDFFLKCDCTFCLQTFRHWPISFDLIRLPFSATPVALLVIFFYRVALRSILL